ncbi:NAD(P)-dependent dehydrogenase, short-chain alcohol dehydrogenase family [Paenibacillus sophorae]|uniref:NAD(P)-dependent dehydrogenase, short-chain alcohol dehydrogenase family n=1 Tax=Paenibacillus sophorae TaxID=1333845 RepID=A0A1H8W042_9BACL|nr:SDR family oxidoreductase [Paenibacillus sophorae]QWU15466.1 SDR family oxidoreductase [Paenibacillus sophorae]SEP21032.1 NAD(P)-dependent dehydrogenase, short-chain alcohol dehydrogenase family [Paenibacillus sophorae]
MDTTNKIALVTGGSRGLGRNSAIALSRKGIDVIVTYHTRKEEAESVVKEIEGNGRKAAALQLDTGDVSSFEAFESQLSTVLKKKWNQEHFDFLINNAGFGLTAPLANTTEEQFDSLMNVHFKGVFFLTQKLISRISDNGGIVNLSTGLTRFALEGYGAYAAMKGAIEILTKYMAKEWGHRGIRVNTVAPGAIVTDFRGGALKENQEARDFFGSQTALGRVGEADDIGGVVASLCTSDMSWVNAQRIEASGGMFL